MKVTLTLDCKAPEEIPVKKGDSIRSILLSKKINLETGIIKLNGKIAHPDKELKDKDSIEFIGVIYGG